ncbi:MAG: VWA domain-containing protein [Planctomycetota bacterium]
MSIMESLTGLVLLDPWMLLLALFVPLGLLLRRWRGTPAVWFSPGVFTREPAIPMVTPLPPGSPVTAAPLPHSWRVRLLRLPLVLHLLGLLLVVVALARPVQRHPLPLETEGIDIFLSIDISSSMAVNDMDRTRSRLDVAKEAAVKFISGRGNDRIGLITFARYPDIRCPLTLDHGALEKFLAEVTLVESDSPEDATGIGTAVARAAQVLRDSVAKSKIVILLTDGEENVATAQTPGEIAPLHAAQLCQELGVRVYTIVAGIGKPDQGGGWTPLDTGQVENLARATGGKFYEARDAGTVGKVYATIDELEKVELVEPRYDIEEEFLPFLIVAMALLLASRLLGSTVLEVQP